jgi:hypothetical protein
LGKRALRKELLLVSIELMSLAARVLTLKELRLEAAVESAEARVKLKFLRKLRWKWLPVSFVESLVLLLLLLLCFMNGKRGMPGMLKAAFAVDNDT